MNTKVICVWNNQEIFEKVVKNNENLKNFVIVDFDNTEKNEPVTKCYNSFIEKSIDKDSDFWCLFVHQDFGFMENIDNILNKLDKKFIYGAIGTKVFSGIFIGRKGKERKIGLKRYISITVGKILQGNNDFNFHEYGLKMPFPVNVESVDCCCIMIHSSLIKKYDLDFDENLSFHMYAEDLCYGAKKFHKIKSKVVQLKCYHLGTGSLNDDYDKSLQYLKEKYNVKYIPSTCPD